MKNLKKLFLLISIISVGLVCLSLSAGALAEKGKLGENISWKFNSSTGQLVLSGSGKPEASSSPFSEDKSIRSVIIKNGITEIGMNMFYGCKNLSSVTLPESLEAVGKGAFSGCKITKVTIPKNVTLIERNAFDSCKSIVVNKNNKSFSSDKYGVLFNKKKTVLIQYPSVNSRTSYKIPDTVKEISDEAFSGASKLKSITLPSGVGKIGFYAFRGCKSLVSIALPKGITVINGGTFAGCKRLRSVIIPDTVTTLEYQAFYGCASLKSIAIPVSVKAIGYNAFYGCNALKNVYFGGTKKQWKALAVEKGNDTLTASAKTYNYKAEKCAHTDLITQAAVAPTCTKKGLSKGKICAICGKVTVKQKVLAVKSHSYKTASLKKATLTANGKETLKCTVCGATKSAYIYAPKTITLSATAYIYDGNVKTPSVTVKDTKGNTLKNGTDYTVKYENGRKLPGRYNVKITFKGKYSGVKRVSFTVAPQATGKVIFSQTTNAVTLKWNKVAGVSGYAVFQAVSGKWKQIKTIESPDTNSCKISGLKSGTTYKFIIKAYKRDSGVIWGKNSAVVTVTTRPDAPSKIAYTSTTSSITLNWSKATGATSYIVYVRTSKGWTALGTTDKLTYTVKNLNKDTKYIFAVKSCIGKLEGNYRQVEVRTDFADPVAVTDGGVKLYPITSAEAKNIKEKYGVRGLTYYETKNKNNKTLLYNKNAIGIWNGYDLNGNLYDASGAIIVCPYCEKTMGLEATHCNGSCHFEIY